MMRLSLARIALALALASASVPPAVCSAGTAALLPALDRVTLAEPPTELADFELTNQNGKRTRLSDLRGEPVLVFFGFAHCPSVCPATLGVLKTVHASKDKAVRRVRIVMISVDGERDTPEAMKAFLAPLSKDFIGLTGDPKAVLEVARQFQAIFFKGPPTNAAGDYLMQHTSQVYLIDRAGRLRATFFDPQADALVRLTRAVADEKS
jgi:protein SCO1/2